MLNIELYHKNIPYRYKVRCLNLPRMQNSLRQSHTVLNIIKMKQIIVK